MDVSTKAAQCRPSSYSFIAKKLFSNPLCGYLELKDCVVVCVPPAVHSFHKQCVFVGGNTAMENLVSKDYFASTHRSPNHRHNVCTAALLTR